MFEQLTAFDLKTSVQLVLWYSGVETLKLETDCSVVKGSFIILFINLRLRLLSRVWAKKNNNHETGLHRFISISNRKRFKKCRHDLKKLNVNVNICQENVKAPLHTFIWRRNPCILEMLKLLLNERLQQQTASSSCQEQDMKSPCKFRAVCDSWGTPH